MIDRISLILKAKNINASQFADEIGVQRSSISHVLSGRNKPSLEFVQKILKRYPELNPDWVLFGKGPMNMEYNLFSETQEVLPLKEETFARAVKKQETLMRPEPEEIKPAETMKTMAETAQEKEELLPLKEIPATVPVTDTTKEKTVETPSLNTQETRLFDKPEEKKVQKIIMFFENKTFREYSPE